MGFADGQIEDGNSGGQPDELHVVCETELARLRAENGSLRAELKKAYWDQCGCLGGRGLGDV